MAITIIGAGAIGGVLGAYLIKAGEEVIFCDIAEDHVNKINQDGLTIEGPEETFTVKGMAYTPEELVERRQTLDTVLLCVKAHHTVSALKPFVPLLTSTSEVVSVQNGLCEYKVKELVGEGRTIGCFVNFSADYIEPGKILYGGVAALYLGELTGELSPRVKQLIEKLSSWGPAKATDNIWGFLWGKMSYAGLLYGTALVDETMATVVRSLKHREMLMELCSEILETAAKENVTPLGFDDWEPNLVYPRESRNQAVLDEQLEKLAIRMASNKKTKSGIWRDLAVRKRKTEVDEQLVPIIEIGEKHGVDMQLTKELVTMIKEIEMGNRQMSWGNLEQLNESFKKKKLMKKLI